MLRRAVLAGLLIALLAGCETTVAWWPMDETSGTTMGDTTGRHDGSLTNVAVGRTGQSGGAYQFDGSSSIARVPHAADLNPGTANFTYSAWIKTTVLPPAATSDIVRKGLSTTSAGDYKMELFPVNGSARVRCYIKGSAGEATAGGGNNLQDGNWHQIICNRTGDTLSLTIDGTKVKSTTVAVGSIANTAELTVGAKPTSQDFYNGLIDDVKITVG